MSMGKSKGKSKGMSMGMSDDGDDRPEFADCNPVDTPRYTFAPPGAATWHDHGTVF